MRFYFCALDGKIYTLSANVIPEFPTAVPAANLSR